MRPATKVSLRRRCPAALASPFIAPLLVICLLALTHPPASAFAPSSSSSLSSSPSSGGRPRRLTATETARRIPTTATATAISAAPEGSVSDAAAPPTQSAPALLLDSALRGGAESASALIDAISDLRRSDDPSLADALLGDLVSRADDGPAPAWARPRRLARFSRRSRLASLRRVLDLSTPEAEGEDDDDAEAAARRRRRALSVLLRTLAAEDGPSISSVEKSARRDAGDRAPADDMADRLPPGLETPRYDVLASGGSAGGGGYEIRRYDAFAVCTVPMNRPRPTDPSKTDAILGNPQLSGASSFGALAGYLFGKNDKNEAMKMTTPVLTSGEGGDRRMSFVLPSNFWDDAAPNKGAENAGSFGIDVAPRPLEGSGVYLERDSGGERAVLMFGGFASKGEVERKRAALLKGLEKDRDWELLDGQGSGTVPTLAQYNDPFTPPWKRRNEVSVLVTKRE